MEIGAAAGLEQQTQYWMASVRRVRFSTRAGGPLLVSAAMVMPSAAHLFDVRFYVAVPCRGSLRGSLRGLLSLSRRCVETPCMGEASDAHATTAAALPQTASTLGCLVCSRSRQNAPVSARRPRRTEALRSAPTPPAGTLGARRAPTSTPTHFVVLTSPQV